MAQIYVIPTTFLQDLVLWKTIRRRCGKLGLLTSEEETKLINWILKIQRLSHPINESTSFESGCDHPGPQHPLRKILGIPGPGWVKWFKTRNPDLTFRIPQGLEQGKAKSL